MTSREFMDFSPIQSIFFDRYVKPKDLTHLVFDGERVNKNGRSDRFELRFMYCRSPEGVLIGRMRDGFSDSSIFAQIEPKLYTTRWPDRIPIKLTQVRRFSIIDYDGYFGLNYNFEGSYKRRDSDLDHHGTWKMTEAKPINLDRQIRKLRESREKFEPKRLYEHWRPLYHCYH